MTAVRDLRAQALLAAIDAWTAATKCTAGELGIMALRHGGFVPLLRKRGTLNPDTDAHLRAFMAAFPDHRALPPATVTAMKKEANAGRPWRSSTAPAAQAQPPAPAPAAKPKVPAAVVVASRLDGRDLATFVSALIAMGLDVWRDDRLSHGEPVA